MIPSINVALVGRNSINREGLHRILALADFNIVQSVAHPSRLTHEGSSEQLLIVLEAAFEAGAHDGIHELRQRFPDAKLALLRKSFEFGEMVDAFRAGAHGYILTDVSCAPLIASLRLVALGEKVMPSELVDALSQHVLATEDDHDRHALTQANLSTREFEILKCLVMGWPNKIISRQLSISDGTVKVHVKAILRKLHVSNRTEAAIRGAFGGLGMKPDRR